MAENETFPRCRMGFAPDPKGFIKIDVTVEMATVEETAAESRKAIEEYKAIVAEKGLKLLEPPAEA